MMKIDVAKYKSLMKNSCRDHQLRNCSLVVDAQNFLYDTYRHSRLPYAFGCECDQYAKYLEKYLKQFRNCNIECYFVFKGGHKDIKSRMIKGNNNSTNTKFTPGSNVHVAPVLTKETYTQVLDEMGFPYVICEFEAKEQCIALAQNLKCPVLSNDKDFYISNVPYVQSKSLKFQNNTVHCEMFDLNSFYKKYNITDEKFAVFIVMVNNYMSSLAGFFKKHSITSVGGSELKERLLSWLSRTTRDDAVEKFLSILNTSERANFLNSEKEIFAFIHRQVAEGIPIDYILKRQRGIDQCDPRWFEKGVASHYIAIPYINLYHWSILWGSWAIEDSEADDSIILSLDIIKYAFKLLTEKQKFCLFREEKGERLDIIMPRRLPLAQSSDQNKNVFQNGWNQLNGATLFSKFLIKTFGEIPINAINQLPEDAKLLMITLAYFWRKREGLVNEVHSIILSYIMLGVVHGVTNGEITIESLRSENGPVLNNAIDEKTFVSDCERAKDSMKDYFALSENDMVNIFDRELLHPLVEFQHCLEHMNNLNRLCGSPYKPTVYRKTYNGTFVYRIISELQIMSGAGINHLKLKLRTSPSILEYFNSLSELLKQMT